MFKEIKIKALLFYALYKQYIKIKWIYKQNVNIKWSAGLNEIKIKVSLFCCLFSLKCCIWIDIRKYKIW